MSGHRSFPALLLALLLCWASMPCCLGNKNADIPKFEPPVQNYAVIDISGDKATEPVSLVALNDANQAAFAFPTGQEPYYWLGNGYDKYHVYTWSNGTLSTEEIIDCFDPIGWPNDGTIPPSTSSYNFADLLATGYLYGTQAQWYITLDANYQRITYAQSGHPSIIDSPSPPFQQFGAHDAYNMGIYMGHVSESGVITGYLEAIALGNNLLNDGSSGGGYILNNGTYTIFDPNPNYSKTTIPANVVIVPNDFSPSAANKQGWAVGYSYTAGGDMVWDGKNLKSLGGDYAAGLNEQCQAIVAAGYYSAPGTEGYFFEGGSSTSLRDTLPFYFQWQISGVQPFAISNQVKAATSATPVMPDTTIHILADANDVETGTSGKTLWTRDNNGNWTFANIALPQGGTVMVPQNTTIESWVSINASGVIAAIGNGGHALLLLPVQLVQTNYPRATLADGTDPGPTGTSIISSGKGMNSSAYITGEPVMPHLQINVASASISGMHVQWWMTTTSERLERGHQDDKNIPSGSDSRLILPSDSTWEIDDYYHPGDFFGGKATIHFVIQDANDYELTSEQKFDFLIRGKNPTHQSAHEYIQAEPFAVSTLYYAWGVAKHESAQDKYNAVYCQFNAGGDQRSLPNYGYPRGWGIFQRDDSDHGIAVTTNQVYSWKINSDVAVQKSCLKSGTLPTTI